MAEAEGSRSKAETVVAWWLNGCLIAGGAAVGALFASTVACADEPTKIWTPQEMGEWIQTLATDGEKPRARDCVDDAGRLNIDCLRAMYAGYDLGGGE